MKTSTGWFELSLAVAGLMVAMLAVMWVQRSTASCTLPREALRHLVLSRAADRDHLGIDLTSANRIARRYGLSTMNPAQQHTRFVACKATLVQSIATTHGLSLDDVRASPTDAQ
jgi:hypothetical protein